MRPRTKTVVVVDDDPIVLAFVADLIDSSVNAKVYPFSNGRKAWEFCRQTGMVDLVVSDVEMPEMNGLELLSLVKTGYPDTSCILVSGDQTYRYMALDLGADAFFSKPFKIKELIYTVRFFLARFHRNITSKVYVPSISRRPVLAVTPAA